MTTQGLRRRHPAVPFPMTLSGCKLHGVEHSPGPARGHRYTITALTAPAAARELVRKNAPASIVDDAEIAVSELVTNALKHAGGADRITMTITASTLILSVTDHQPDLPLQLPRLDPDAVWDLTGESGRGLLMILAFGAELAVRRTTATKRVTARLPIGDPDA